MTAAGHTPRARTFSLDPTGLRSKESHVEESVTETTVAITDSAEAGFARLSVGPASPIFPHLGYSASLDATACRHLAALLESKAGELDRSSLIDREGRA